MILQRTAKIKNFPHFIRIGSNKQSLFKYIAGYTKSLHVGGREQLVITCYDSIITNPKSANSEASLSPCDYEEGNTRMLLHIELILQRTVSLVIL